MERSDATDSKVEKVSRTVWIREMLRNQKRRKYPATVSRGGCYGVQKGKRVWNRIKKSMSTDLKQEKYLGTV